MVIPSMSSASGSATGSAADLPVDPASVRTVLRQSVLAPLRFLGFWAAVFLPLAYLPLVHGGLDAGETTVLAALAVVNALAVVLGHGYRA